uniref:Uncharacterized protein n=1 Tax=Manihot esculenta TaxID=3983 RepID=A0A199UAG8_MANES
MICVCLLLEFRHGLDLFDIRLLMNGGHGFLMIKYLQGYDYNFAFLTIKGAGYTVREYMVRESLDFYSCWLDEMSLKL